MGKANKKQALSRAEEELDKRVEALDVADAASDEEPASAQGSMRSLKWRPGLSGQEQRLRARELREANLKRRLQRQARHESSAAEVLPRTSVGEDDAGAAGAAPNKATATATDRQYRPAAILQRLLWAESNAEAGTIDSPAELAVWLLDPEGDSHPTKLCRRWVRTASCHFGSACRHVHGLTLAGARGLTCSRGAAMPPIHRAEDPAALDIRQTRLVAFIITHGMVAYDYEDPSAALRFVTEGGTQDETGFDTARAGVDSVSEARGSLDSSASLTPSVLSAFEVITLPIELWSKIMSSEALGVLDLCALVCSCAALASTAARPELWTALEARTFGTDATLKEVMPEFLRMGPANVPSLPGYMRLGPRQRCTASEAALSGWRGVARRQPEELLLPCMTSLCLGVAGELGVSTHDGRMTRLWERRSGRRLTCYQHKTKATLTCCHIAGTHVAVGDAAGAVHLFDTESEDFTPTFVLQASESNAAVASIIVMPASRDRPPICIASYLDGLVAVEECDSSSRPGEVPLSWRHQLDQPPDGHAARDGFICAGDVRADATFFIAHATAVCCYNVEHPQPMWRAAWVTEAEGGIPFAQMSVGGDASGRRPPTSALPVVGRSLASYSRGWRMLAAINDVGECVLWDTQLASERGPVGRISLPRAAAAGSVHLDPGGDGWAGYLHLVSLESSAVHVYDIRRARAPLGGSIPGEMGEMSFEAMPVATLLAPAGAKAMPCIAVEAGSLVMAGGAKGACAYQWRTDAHGSALQGGGAGSLDEDMDPTSSSFASSKTKVKPKKLRGKDHSRASRPQ